MTGPQENTVHTSQKAPATLSGTAASNAESGTKGVAASRMTATQKLLKAAATEVVLCKSTDGTLMAAKASQSHLMYPLAGAHPVPLVPVFVQYNLEHGKPAPKDAIGQVRMALEQEASLNAPRPVHLRAARLDAVLWLDTGWGDGSVVRISPSSWRIEHTAPVLFRRSNVTKAIADPRSVQPDLSLLNKYVHCRREDLPLIFAVLITVWFSDVPQPIFSLFGSADSGKTTAMRFLLDLIDPSETLPGGPLDKDPRNLKALSTVRRVMCFDNVSSVDAGMSDLLARISTGGELVHRAMYTNDEAHITELMRPVWLNGIMSGYARADLASRAVLVELLPVSSADRVPLEDLWADWREDQPAILAGLLDLAADVLQTRSDHKPTGTHRNAEFERNLLAIDALLGTQGAARMVEQAMALEEAVLDSTPLGMILRRMVDRARTYRQPSLFANNSGMPRMLYDDDDLAADRGIFGEHTHEHLKSIIDNEVNDQERRGLPQTTRALSDAIRRLEPTLRSCLAVEVDRGRRGDARLITFRDLRA